MLVTASAMSDSVHPNPYERSSAAQTGSNLAV